MYYIFKENHIVHAKSKHDLEYAHKIVIDTMNALADLADREDLSAEVMEIIMDKQSMLQIADDMLAKLEKQKGRGYK